MIASIKEFFNQFIEPGTRPNEAGGAHALQIATAALLLEMMRMDGRIAAEERAAIGTVMCQQFAIDADQYATLIALAEREAQQASDYYQFTSLINKTCSAAQKNIIIENLWHVAMIDGHLDAHELHLMRKIADLLYVSHADYVAAKQRARNTARLPPAG
ncbi:MAG: TerB family tellurite resistance protein [Rhodocyclaceae bacterium]|nr:TerB family tellurite resistance protein [Rhodocyclaceae bacterium]